MGANITRNVEVLVSISAFEMGKAFAEMDAEDQAQFFNGVSVISDSYPRPACFQWDMMREAMSGKPDALRVFRDMAEYAGLD